MPTSVRVAVVVMALLSSLLLLTAGLLGVGFDAAVDGVTNQGSGVSRASASQFVLVSLLVNLVLGVMLVGAAWFLPRRQPWARWVGLAAVSTLGLLTLFQILTAGGVTLISLLSLVLTVAVISSLAAKTTTAWLPSVRDRA